MEYKLSRRQRRNESTSIEGEEVTETNNFHRWDSLDIILET